MSDLLESLLEQAPAAHDVRLCRVEVTGVTNDSAAVAFTMDGRQATGVLPVSEANPRFSWSVGSEFVALLTRADRDVMFSCADTRVVERLFASIVPEIRTGEIQVMGVVRSAGARSKIAVASVREGLDPVAALVGRGHNRVDFVKDALGGEQVDVVAWHPQQEVFLANALQPARVKDVRIDAKAGAGFVAADGHQMAAAVGGRGLNATLAAELLGLASVKVTQG